MVNIARGLEAPAEEVPSPDTPSTGPASALTEHAAMPAAFVGDMVESVKGSAPGATAGVPDALDPDRTNTLHRKLGFVDLYTLGNKLSRNER